MENQQSSVLLKKIQSAHFDILSYPNLEEFALCLGAEFVAKVNDQIGEMIEVSGAKFSAFSGQRSFEALEETHMLFMAKSPRDTCAIFISVSFNLGGAIAEAMFGGDFTFDGAANAATSVDAAILTNMLDETLVRLGGYSFPKGGENRAHATARVAPMSFAAKDVTACGKQTFCNASIDMMCGDAVAENAISFHFPMGYLESLGLLEKGRKPDLPGDDVSHWRHELTANVASSEIELDIILGAYDAKLSELASLKVGEVIPLSSSTDKVSNIVLRTASGAQQIGAGRLGAYKTNKAVKLMGALDLMDAKAAP